MSRKPTGPAAYVSFAPAAALQALGLGPEDLAALKSQGTITAERRGRRTLAYKLRYRVGGQQQVKYLGTDENYIQQLRRELADLQAAHRQGRHLQRLEKQAREVLRASKQLLVPHLPPAGFKFHGLAIRRSRRPQAVGIDLNSNP